MNDRRAASARETSGPAQVRQSGGGNLLKGRHLSLNPGMNPKRLLSGCGVALLMGLGAIVLTRPDSYHIERSLVMEAPVGVVRALVGDLPAWQRWSPWESDPAMTRTYAGAPGGVGSTYVWSGNATVGEGRLTLTALGPDRIDVWLERSRPDTRAAELSFRLEPRGETGTTVLWTMEGHRDLADRLAGMLATQDSSSALGDALTQGLQNLKERSELEASAPHYRVADDDAPPDAATP